MAKIFDKIFGEDKGEDKGFKQGSQLSRSNGTAFGFKATGLGAQKDTLGQKVIDMNYTDWTEGDDYKNLTKRYSDQGRAAMDDTTGMLAARTGGLASSYATRAGQQAYGDWMTRLEDAARSLYDNERGDALENYGIASSDYDRQYNMYDNDRKFAFDQDKFDVSQSNWEKEFNYNANRDAADDLEEMLYYNPNMTYQQYLAANPLYPISEKDFNNTVAKASGMREVNDREWNDKQYQDATSSLYSYIYNGYGYDSYEDYVKKTNSPISKQDYEAIVGQATDDREDANNAKGYTREQLENQEIVNSFITTGEWDDMSDEKKEAWAGKTGHSVAFWDSRSSLSKYASENGTTESEPISLDELGKIDAWVKSAKSLNEAIDLLEYYGVGGDLACSLLLRYFDEERVFYALGIEDEETKEEIKKTLYADYTGIPDGGGRVEVSRFD